MRSTARVASAVVCCLSITIPSSVLAQRARERIPVDVNPRLSAYADCAKEHIAQIAKGNPTTSFDKVENSLRPACGVHIERARDALFRKGFDRNEANTIIRSAYATMQPELRALFDQTASSERQRHAAEKDKAAQQQPQLETEKAPYDLEAERVKFLKEVSDAYDACLVTETGNLAASSNEPAETLVKVIDVKCGDQGKRYERLGFALYGETDNFKKFVKQPIEERKKRLVADIVTFRVDLAKEEKKQQKESPAVQPGPKPPGAN